MIRVGGPQGGGRSAAGRGNANDGSQGERRLGIHLELTTDDLDALYEQLQGARSSSSRPPHKSHGNARRVLAILTAIRWSSPKAVRGTAE